METAVNRIYEDMISSDENIPNGEKVRLDIMAIALNNLPPKYTVTEKGNLFTKVNTIEQQFRTDIICEIMKAMEIVSQNP
ncbi:MAG: competence protein ComFB [Clostridiales bacterium]|nr:MAG: competence protein ComFB [Clostridiales bacterium]